MRPSKKFEAKAAGQKCSPGVVCSTLRTFFHRQRRHRALQSAAIERVIGIGSKLPSLIKITAPKPSNKRQDAKAATACFTTRNRDCYSAARTSGVPFH